VREIRVAERKACSARRVPAISRRRTS